VRDLFNLSDGVKVNIVNCILDIDVFGKRCVYAHVVKQTLILWYFLIEVTDFNEGAMQKWMNGIVSFVGP
jgi:hypothetical protein